MFYPALFLFEQANCIDWINLCYILSLTENTAFSGTPVTCYILSFRNLVVNPVHFLSTENIKRGNKGNNYIISLFNSKYKHRWINRTFLQDKHNINAVS